MDKPIITKDCIKTLFETKFIKVTDIQYAPGKHYYNASRRDLQELTAIKSDEDFREMCPDAVSCFVVIKTPDDEPRLLMQYEFRYPVGRFLLSPPAGLIDEKDKHTDDAVLSTAKREIFEETGITVKDSDELYVVSPLVFSTPGMSDESNAIACAVVELDSLGSLNQDGAEGSECFDGFCLLTKAEAQEVLKNGRDEHGFFYSVYTWAALLYFISKF